MDRLFKRYADPFSFMDGMIRTGRFTEFVESFWNAVCVEKDEETIWEYYLHREFTRSFDDFKKELKEINENLNMSERTIETTFNHSMDILNNFIPDERG